MNGLSPEREFNMAKEIKTLAVKGKYAAAVVNGSIWTKAINTLSEKVAGLRETVLDKTLKIPEGEQSVRLTVAGSAKTALLSAKRSVTITVDDELKAKLNGGNYKDVLKVNRSMAFKNPDDITKAIAILSAAGIEASIEWDVKTTAAALDKYRKEKGADQFLGDRVKVEEKVAVEFEVG